MQSFPPGERVVKIALAVIEPMQYVPCRAHVLVKENERITDYGDGAGYNILDLIRISLAQHS